jgi:hypothetical protein
MVGFLSHTISTPRPQRDQVVHPCLMRKSQVRDEIATAKRSQRAQQCRPSIAVQRPDGIAGGPSGGSVQRRGTWGCSDRASGRAPARPVPAACATAVRSNPTARPGKMPRKFALSPPVGHRPMQCGAQIAIGGQLQKFADIHHQRARARRHLYPPLRGFHLHAARPGATRRAVRRPCERRHNSWRPLNLLSYLECTPNCGRTFFSISAERRPAGHPCAAAATSGFFVGPRLASQNYRMHHPGM